ncbi:hypothetical protein R1sor_001360 [Riccia sorocarpa]|uniref:GDSL esterase/lipase n=1 Tax=Riccia sorocarpa TaxID=122646 RepID=A0ABD3GW29_9MARC
MTRLKRFTTLVSFFLGLLVCQQVQGEAEEGCFSGIFAFGDGQFDTGTVSGTFPTILAYDHPPYGQTYFKKPAGRYSDGRLMLDFLAEALGLGFVSAALQTVNSDYSSGATWASAFSTIQSVAAGHTAGPGLFLSPFGIGVQVMQFVEFQISVNSEVNKQAKLMAKLKDGFTDDAPAEETPKKKKKDKKPRHFLQEVDNDDETVKPLAVNITLLELEANTMRLPKKGSWSDALYLIGTGAHDIINGFNNGKSIKYVEDMFPRLVNTLGDSVTRLHHLGARNMIVFGIEPQGCQPWLLTRIQHTADDLDWKGCLVTYNNVVQNFNRMLRNEVAHWRMTHEGLNIYYFSQYDVKTGLLTNDTAGFKSTNTACCGVAGSTYNVNLMVPCGPPAMDPATNMTETPTVCSNPNEYLYWDGMYTTEAGNKYVVQQMLTGKYFDIPFPRLTEKCVVNLLS